MKIVEAYDRAKKLHVKMVRKLATVTDDRRVRTLIYPQVAENRAGQQKLESLILVCEDLQHQIERAEKNIAVTGRTTKRLEKLEKLYEQTGEA